MLSTGLALGPAAATNYGRRDPVRFVLEPSWLPAGYSPTGGGWVSPAGGLHVYPEAGGAASVITVGSAPDTQRSTPVLFTLNYYGFHNPESKSIRLVATEGFPEPTDGDSRGTLSLGGRSVTIASHTEGVFHNVVTTASWDERGDSVLLITEGLTTNQAAHFVRGLIERKPPRG